MTMDLFCILLVAFGTANTVVTEFVKKLFDTLKVKVHSGIIALICGAIVGILGTFGYYFMNGVAFTAPNITFAIIEGVCVVIGSQIGYDKIVAVIKEIAAKESE